MTDSEQLEVFKRLINLASPDVGFELSEVNFFVKGDEVGFEVWCKGLYGYACEEYELITIDNIAEFERAVRDCESVEQWFSLHMAVYLFIARLRKKRPVASFYWRWSMSPAKQRLFEDCGPVWYIDESQQTGKQTEFTD